MELEAAFRVKRTIDAGDLIRVKIRSEGISVKIWVMSQDDNAVTTAPDVPLLTYDAKWAEEVASAAEDTVYKVAVRELCNFLITETEYRSACECIVDHGGDEKEGDRADKGKGNRG
jgi:hypothetical protein